MNAPSDPLRVLVVDDELLIADSLAAILSLCGYDVMATYSAEQAVEKSDTFNPNAVLSDVIMGGMSGFDLADHLAEHKPACKVLLISGHPAASALEAAAARAGRRYPILAKPFPPEDIFEFLANCAPSA